MAVEEVVNEVAAVALDMTTDETVNLTVGDDTLDEAEDLVS